jgi:flagellar hook-associated protein 1 FlgK
MSGLFSSLHTASTALNVFSRSLGTDQANVANASTPGYAAARANILPIDISGSGSSADFISLSSSSDSRADALVRAASSQASSSQTQAQELSPVNQLFDITGSTGILAALQQFSSAFSSLSVSPNDATLGAAALNAAGNVASAFQSVAASLDDQRNQLDSSIQATTAQINSLAGQIRQLNIQARGQTEVNPGLDASFRTALEQLSSLVDITVLKNADGSISVLAGGELPLVNGDQAYSLTATPAAPPGTQVSSSAGGSSPGSFSGQLGALLQTRNGAITQLLGSDGDPGVLNTLAAGFASRVNSLLAAGHTTSGAAGSAIFTFDSTDPANAARTLALDTSVTPAELGVATTGASGQSNGVANQLAALPGSKDPADQIDGLSPLDLFASIAASVGQQLASAQDASAADQTTLTSAQSNRQQRSGVSLDQEAVTITALQRSYEASARIVSILDELSGDEVNLIK